MDQRPDPDKLLKQVQAEESGRGRLKLFFGANAGVGKTYAMLEAAQARRKEGVDVVIGVVETHGRVETAALLQGLEVLPRRKIEYKGVVLEEFDLEAALARKPQLILVDELAHTNATGSRHSKRWQDVQELLEAGIGVYTTLNVQHWESLNDVVAQITGVVVRETVPDTFLEQTHDIELVDIPAEDLLKRLKEGKVYIGPEAEKAAEHFFQPGNLIALRELALRHTAERVDLQIQTYKTSQTAGAVWPVAERLLVGVTEGAMAPRLVRAAHRLAARLRCEWIVLHVETPDSIDLPAKDKDRLLETLRLAEELGAETVTLTGNTVPERLVEYARSRNVSKIIVGKPRRPLWRDRLFGSVVNQIAHLCGDMDLYVISGVGAEFKSRRPVRERTPTPWTSWVWAAAMVGALTFLCWFFLRRMDEADLIMVYLLVVMGTAYRFGRGPAILAAVLSVLSFGYFFVPPYFTLAGAEPNHIVTFVVMLAVGFMIGTITGRLRSLSEASIGRETRTWSLYRLSRELSETPEPKELTVKAWQHLEEFYKTSVLILKADGAGSLVPAAGSPDKFGFDQKEAAVAQWVYDRGQEAGAGTNTLAASKGLYLPLRGLQGTVGVLGIRPMDVMSAEDPEQLHLLQTFASEIGAALASTELSEAAGRAEAQVEAERLRNLILSSFSLDVNEPLTQVSRITRRLLQSTPALPGSVRQGLAEIEDKVLRLAGAASELPRIIESRTKAEPAGSPVPAPGAVRVSDFLSPDTILISKAQKPKERLLKELIATLRVPESENALELVMEREKAGSTIIGSGLSIPHARIPGLGSIKTALGIVPKGLAGSKSEEEKSVQLVMLFLSPAEDLRGHLAFLAAVTALFQKEGLAHDLGRSAGPKEVLEKIRSAE